MLVLVRILLDFRAALRAALEGGRPLVDRVGLALQRLVEHLLGQDMANGLNGVLDGTEFGAPSWPLVAIEAINETLGDAFEVGTDGVGRSGGNRELSHPGTCWRMRGSGMFGGGNVPRVPDVGQTQPETIFPPTAVVTRNNPRRKPSRPQGSSTPPT